MLNKSIIVGNNIIRVVLIFKLFVFSLITVANLVGWDFLVFVLVLGVDLDVSLILHVHLLFELDLPLLNETIIVDNIISGIILIFELLIFGLISVTNFVGWNFLVLLSSLALIFHVNLRLKLELPLLHKSVIVNNIISGIIFVFEFFIFGFITVGNFVGWKLLVFELNFSALGTFPLVNESVVVGNNIIRIILVFELSVLVLVTITDLIGWLDSGLGFDSLGFLHLKNGLVSKNDVAAIVNMDILEGSLHQSLLSGS